MFTVKLIFKQIVQNRTVTIKKMYVERLREFVS